MNRGGVRHSASKGDYIWNANGRSVSDAQIQKQLDKLNDAYYDNVTRLAERLDSGNLSIAQWQERMRKEVKDVHRTNYIIGRGGVDKMTPRDWGRLGSDLRWMQYKALDGFALDIANGKRLPDGSFRPYSEAEIKARSRLYVNASNKQYWRGKTEAKLAAGFVEEQRFLNPAEHCGDCEGFAARGRVPIGTLPPPGEDSECQTNCKCTMKYYKVDETPAAVQPQVEPAMPEPPPRRQLERDRFRRFEVPDARSSASRGEIDSAKEEIGNWGRDSSYEGWNASLSDKEREWLELYKQEGYEWINAELRGDIGASYDYDFNPTDVRKATKAMDAAMKRHRLPNDVTLWRGGSHPEITKALESGRDIDDLAGMIISDDAYVSTSLNSGAADPFVKWAGDDAIKFEIQAPRGTRGAYIEYMDDSMEEYEYLLERGTRFEILEASVIDGVRHIVARVIL
jgi:hypothetical protein